MFHSSKAHLASVNETYFEHQRVAFRYGFDCVRAGLMAFVHGLVPGWFQTSASGLVQHLARGRKSQAQPEN